eukprot:CAMPEP_0197263644 /NCGR_PEP_ID=MMETSP1432-20130617/1298_1 /TAXON_ID=44447 /ORGANISM="Pseudo-nitzschia delicatissima, Strain UNC1205" /LENGTH=174 /DNA_ID=CAMNT_0042728175 /DNA_START=80 /DNA_END=604 /DNA_ORIENTATION=-
MIAPSRILSILAFLAVVLVTLPSLTSGFDVMALIPQELLDKIPDVCRATDDSEFQEAVNCAFDNLATCSAIIGKLKIFQELPTLDEISECEDIQDPFCEIATTCPICMDKFDTAVRCIVRSDPTIETRSIDLLSNSTEYIDLLSNYTDDLLGNSTYIADLVDSCALTCDVEERM